MVLLQESQLVSAYQQIRQRWKDAGEKGVHCIVGADIDALCALKITMQLISADRIMKFAATPVQSFQDLKQVFAELGKDPTTTTLILINCGGTYPIADLLPQGDYEVHIIDSHRPVHLSNIEARAIHVWQDGDVGQLLRVSEMFAKKKVSKKRQRTEDDDDDDGADSESSEEWSDVSEDDLAGKTEETRRLEQRYYRGHWHGPPSTSLLYEVASRVLPDPPDDILWFAFVALADYLLAERIPRAEYDKRVVELLHQVSHRNLKKPEREKAGEDEIEYNAFHNLRLEESTEYHLFLLRHSSLWDALYNSSFVSAKLQLYQSERSIEDLRQLLHGRLGLKQEECMMEWGVGKGERTWDKEQRKGVLTSLEKHLRHFGVTDFSFRSAVKTQGYRLTVAAPDFALMLVAVLSHPPLDEKNEAHWKDTFWKAFDMLDNRRTDLLDEGIEKAKALQAAVVRQTAFLLQKEYVRNTGPFRYTFVNEASSDLPFFVHPLPLHQLARALVASIGEDRRRGKSRKRPLLLLALDKSSELYTIVPAGDVGRKEDKANPFGYFLREAVMAAELDSSATKEAGFDMTCMRISKREARALLDSLALQMYKREGQGGAVAP